jgi:hypothetical protein
VTPLARTANLSLALVVGLLAAAPLTAQAQEDPRPQQARAACAGGDVQRGVALLEEIHRATEDLVWVFNQGRCYQDNGQREKALERFQEYLRRAPPTAAETRQRAETIVAQLQEQLRSSQPAPPVAPQTPPPAPPAEVRPPAIAGPAPKLGGEPATAELPALATSADTSVDDFDQRRKRLYITSAALAGVSVLALSSGFVFGAKVRSLESEVEDWGKATDLRPVAEYNDLRSRANRFETLQWIGYGTAAAALVGAGVCFYLTTGLEPDRPQASHTGRKMAVAPLLGPGLHGANVAVSF